MKAYLIAAAACAALAACEATPTTPDAGAVLSGLGIPDTCSGSPPVGLTMNMICAGTDLWKKITLKPAADADFDYSETDDFDMQLSSSMRAALPAITVTNSSASLPLETTRAQANPTPGSARLVFWLTQIEKTGGEVKVCENVLEGSIADWLIQMASRYIGERLTYGPAKDYDATLFYDSQKTGSPIEKIVFTKRTGNALSCG